MIVYLDASALVKVYVAEAGSTDVAQLIQDAEVLGTGIVSRAEVPAALAKASRAKLVTAETAGAALAAFTEDWEDLIRLQLTEGLAAHAGALAWEQRLRGYDAVHLATALFWQAALAEPVTVATFDRQLWRAARATGLEVWPHD
jgi:uncharacterized protein